MPLPRVSATIRTRAVSLPIRLLSMETARHGRWPPSRERVTEARVTGVRRRAQENAARGNFLFWYAVSGPTAGSLSLLVHRKAMRRGAEARCFLFLTECRGEKVRGPRSPVTFGLSKVSVPIRRGGSIAFNEIQSSRRCEENESRKIFHRTSNFSKRLFLD